MKQIGIKLADGTFYPVLEEDVPKTRKLDLTTVKDNQTKVQVDLYRSETGTMDDAEYVDTLEVSKLNPRPNGEPNLHLSLNLDENGELNAEVIDGETGKKSELQVNLVTRTLAERENSEPDFVLEPPIDTSELDSFSFNDARPTETPVASEPQPEIDTTAPFSFDTAPEPAAEEDFPLPDFDSLPQSDTAPAADSSGDSLDLPDFGDDNAASADDAPADTTASDDFSLPDFDALETPASDTAPAADSGGDSLDLPDFGDNNAAPADDAPADTTASDDFSLPDFNALDAPADTAPAADSSDSLDLPDFGDNNTASVDDAPADTTVNDDFSLPDFDALDAPAPDTAPAADSSGDSLDLPDFGDDNAASADDAPAATAASDDFSLPDFDALETPVPDAAPAADSSGDSLDLPDFGDDNAASADDTLAATTASDDFSLPDFDALGAPANTAPAADSLDLPDFGDNSAASADDTPAATTANDDFSLPDFDALDATANTAPAADSSGDSLDLPDFGDNNAAPADDAPAATTANDDFSLPDFDALDATAPNAAPAANNAFSIESLDLPDFGDTDINGGTDVALPDFNLSATNAIGTELNLDDPAFDDPIFTTPTKAEKASSGGLMDFSDLYDKETLAGGSTMASEPDDNSRRKTRVPVIVCVVCAMICTLATLLVLFIIPSRYNLLLSRKLLTEQTTAPVAMAQPENAVAVTESSPAASLQSAPAIAPAREDVIVIAPNASTVVPAPTVSVAPAVTPKRSGDVTYRIKWGDTLWDISDAYYNNPWKYPRIADYNRIPNPDLIIAGTDIKIPKE